MRISWVLAAMIAVTVGQPASAAILVNQPFFQYSYFVGDGGILSNFTSALAAQPGGYFIGDLENSSDIASASAMFVNLRSFDIGSYGDPIGNDQQLTALEVANINSFLETGRRVAIIGENFSFTNWDTSVLALANGGTVDPITGSSGLISPIVANEITNGTGSLNIAEGGGHTTGGTELYDKKVVTLWRPQNNLLTIFDLNTLDDSYGNKQFEQNVAAWLGASSPASVPEPKLWVSMILGFGLIGSLIRGSRRRPDRARSPICINSRRRNTH